MLFPFSGWAFSKLLRDVGRQKGPLPKICHLYTKMIKLGTVIPYLKKIQKIYKSRDAPSIFPLEISNFYYIKKYRYRMHF